MPHPGIGGDFVLFEAREMQGQVAQKNSVLKLFKHQTV